MAKFEPVGVAHWRLKIPSIDGAGFHRKVSGLSWRVEYQKHSYEGEPGKPVTDYHPSGGPVIPGVITLERGLDLDQKLWEWHKKVIDGQAETADGELELLNHKGDPVAKFSFKGAWPSKYTTSGMSARSKGVVATETIEISVDELSRDA